MNITDLRTTIAGNHLHDELWAQIDRSCDLVGLMEEDVKTLLDNECIDQEFMSDYDILVRCTNDVVGDLLFARRALKREVSGSLSADEFAAQTYNEVVCHPINESAPRLRSIIRQADALAEHDDATESLHDVAQSSALTRLVHVCENIADLGMATAD